MSEPVATYKLIDNIYKLTLDKFIDCMCDQNLSVLVISGKPSDIDLLECWSKLYSQYLDVLDDSETVYILQLQRDIELLQFKIVTTEAIIKVLRFVHVGQLVQQLKDFGFTTINLKQGHSGYEHALKKIEARLIPLKLKLKEKSGELLDYYRDKEMDTVSRSFFTRQLQRLSKFQGYPIRPKTTVVPDYVMILKDYLSINTKSKDDGETR